MTTPVESVPCRLCGNQVEEKQGLLNDEGTSYRTAYRVRCARCGVYDITYMLESWLEKYRESLSQEERYRLSAITRMATERGEVPEELSTQTYRDLLDTTPQPTPMEQARLVLQYLAKRYKPGQAPVAVDPAKDYPIASAFGPNGLIYIVKSLQDDGLIEVARMGAVTSYKVTMRGFEKLAEGVAAMAISSTGDAGWQRVEREIGKARVALAAANHEEDYQMVGQLCGQALISLGQAVFDPVKHKTIDETPASDVDAKRMLEAFLAVEFKGSSNVEARRLVREAVKFAEAVKHGRSGDRVRASICYENTRAIIAMIAAIAGKTRPPD